MDFSKVLVLYIGLFCCTTLFIIFLLILFIRFFVYIYICIFFKVYFDLVLYYVVMWKRRLDTHKLAKSFN